MFLRSNNISMCDTEHSEVAGGSVEEVGLYRASVKEQLTH